MPNGIFMPEKGMLRYVILIGSIAFVITGILRNEVSDVWQKAINICLECIGIG